MRSVEVALGYKGGQWDGIWVELEEEDNNLLEDSEIETRAEELALKLAAKMKKNVAFVKILYIAEPDDQGFDG